MRLLARASLGNLGDWRALSDAGGIAELRDHYGPGYRVYFSFGGRRIIPLLTGSTKRDQKKAIKRASACLRDYQERTGP
jgi:putative addiction module killer protein